MKTARIFKKVAKWTGVAFAGLIVIFLFIYAFAATKTGKRLRVVYEVDYIIIVIPSDTVSIARGAHLTLCMPAGIAMVIIHIAKPEEMVSVDFGATLAINCIGCHGTEFQGGPSVLPDHPPVSDISSAGRIGKWTEEQFMQTLRTGITPDGHKFDNATMPWTRFGVFSDVELKALRKYLLNYPLSGKTAAGLSAK